MSLELMRKRVNAGGGSVREAQIQAARHTLEHELELDPSYDPDMYIWESGTDDDFEGYDARPAHSRIYNRKWSSLNGNYQYFTTTIDNPIYIGDYFHDVRENTYWLVLESYNIDDIQYNGRMVQCNYLIKWQDDNGTVHGAWANIVTASKYSVGEDWSNNLIETSNDYTVLMGYADERLDLEGKRVFIDRRDTNPTKVFTFSRSDDVIWNSMGKGSILSFIADKDLLNLETDNQELRLCDYYRVPDLPEPDRTAYLNAEITGFSTIKIGFPRTYTAVFYDNEGNVISAPNYKWNVIARFDVTQEVIDKDKIRLQVDDARAVDGSLLLQILDMHDKLVTSVSIPVEDAY